MKNIFNLILEFGERFTLFGLQVLPYLVVVIVVLGPIVILLTIFSPISLFEKIRFCLFVMVATIIPLFFILIMTPNTATQDTLPSADASSISGQPMQAQGAENDTSNLP